MTTETKTTAPERIVDARARQMSLRVLNLMRTPCGHMLSVQCTYCYDSLFKPSQRFGATESRHGCVQGRRIAGLDAVSVGLRCLSHAARPDSLASHVLLSKAQCAASPASNSR